MLTTARRRTLMPALGAALVALGGIVGALAVAALAGTKTGFVLAIVSIGGPVLVYVAIVAPLVLPFGLYVGLIPFDNLLSISAFGTLTKILGIASGAALIFYLVRTRKAVKPPPSLFLWVALYIWAGATAFWAFDDSLVLGALTTSLQLVVLYTAIAIFPADKTAVRWTSFAIVAGGIAAAAYGAYLFHSGVDIYYGSRLRITTDTGDIDPNHFAAAMLLPISLCLTYLVHTRKLLVAVASIAALGMLFVGVTLSASRGAVLAIGFMLVYFLIRSRARIRLGAILMGMFVAAVAFSSQTDLWNRFGVALSTGGNGRTSIWWVGWEAFKRHWLAGAGYGNFPLAYDQVFLQSPHQIWDEASWHRASHDLLVGTSVELGIVGVVLLLAAWVAQFYMLRDVAPSDPEYPLRVASEATVLGIFIAAMFLDVMTFKYVWLAFMFIALLRNAHYLRRRSTGYA